MKLVRIIGVLRIYFLLSGRLVVMPDERGGGRIMTKGLTSVVE